MVSTWNGTGRRLHDKRTSFNDWTIPMSFFKPIHVFLSAAVLMLAVTVLPLNSLGVGYPAYAEVNGSRFANRGTIINFPEIDGSTDSTKTFEVVKVKGKWSRYTLDVFVSSLEDTCYITLEGSNDNVHFINLDADGTRAVTADGSYRYNYGYANTSLYFRHTIAFADTSIGQSADSIVAIGE